MLKKDSTLILPGRSALPISLCLPLHHASFSKSRDAKTGQVVRQKKGFFCQQKVAFCWHSTFPTVRSTLLYILMIVYHLPSFSYTVNMSIFRHKRSNLPEDILFDFQTYSSVILARGILAGRIRDHRVCCWLPSVGKVGYEGNHTILLRMQQYQY